MAISFKNLERKLFEDSKETPKVEVPEWIWVEGYKGTDKDMKCRDYQYELGKQFDMPEGSEIDCCNSGFHFCTKLRDVFTYYDVENGNRFFKVRALVRKEEQVPSIFHCGDSKETSKSIEFISELTTDEILKAKSSHAKDFNDEEKEQARLIGVQGVLNARKIGELMQYGYVYDVAEYIVTSLKKYEAARVLGQQTDISMDTRILVLFNGDPNTDYNFKIKHLTMPITNPYISPISAIQN